MTDKMFVFHSVLAREEICNYVEVKKELLASALRGERRTIFGRRNIGKTSVIQNAVVPDFKLKHKNNCFVIFIDFYGVRTLDHIRDRVEEAFQKAFVATFPKTALAKAAARYLTGLRPMISTDPLTNEVGISFESSRTGPMTLDQIFDKFKDIHESQPCFLVCDEFQDISFVPQAEGKLRRIFENLPSRLPIFILGSKQHLLAEMFAKPRAPFAGWGIAFEFPKIEAADYQQYINDRFSFFNLNINKDVVNYLLERMQFVPESVNIVCDALIKYSDKKLKNVARENIEHAIAEIIVRASSVYRTLIGSLSDGEENTVRCIAKLQPVTSVRTKQFLSLSKMSATGASKALKNLLDDGHVLREEKGYFVSDPLLAEFLRHRV